MARYMLHWLHGKRNVVEGSDIADAFRKAGYGGGAIRALDYFEEIWVNPQNILEEFSGWDVQEDHNGFYIYSKDGFTGCIRQNGVNGTTEVFMSPAQDVIADSNQDGAVYVEDGISGSDGRQEFERAVLFVDLLSDGEKGSMCFSFSPPI